MARVFSIIGKGIFRAKILQIVNLKSSTSVFSVSSRKMTGVIKRDYKGCVSGMTGTCLLFKVYMIFYLLERNENIFNILIYNSIRCSILRLFCKLNIINKYNFSENYLCALFQKNTNTNMGLVTHS